MNSTQAQLEQKTLELKGEIRNLTKEKTDLLDGNTRIRNAQDRERVQTTAELTGLKKAKDRLTKEVRDLTLKQIELSENITLSKKDILRFESVQMGKAQEEADKLRGDAKILLKDAEVVKERLNKRAEELATVSEVIKVTQKKLDEQKVRQDAWDLEQEERKMSYQKAIQKDEQTLFELNEAKEQAISLAKAAWLDFETAKTNKRKIDEDIATRLDNLIRAENNVTIREKAVNLREDDMANKKEALRIETAQLEDKQQTLKRSYDEIIAKGGKVDGF